MFSLTTTVKTLCSLDVYYVELSINVKEATIVLWTTVLKP